MLYRNRGLAGFFVSGKRQDGSKLNDISTNCGGSAPHFCFAGCVRPGPEPLKILRILSHQGDAVGHSVHPAARTRCTAVKARHHG